MAKKSFREKIISLADNSQATWESIAREVIAQMSEKEAEDFYDYFIDNYM
jgi:hypothetical protein